MMDKNIRISTSNNIRIKINQNLSTMEKGGLVTIAYNDECLDHII